MMAIFIGKPPDRVLTEEALDPDDNFLIAICESGSAKSARNPRLGEAGRNGGKDGEMRGIRKLFKNPISERWGKQICLN